MLEAFFGGRGMADFPIWEESPVASLKAAATKTRQAGRATSGNATSTACRAEGRGATFKP
jgi:hypothetical protein